MSVAIKISHAVKKYGNNTVIPDLSLDIREGEFFTLLGPSGCGKTTLLRMIAGFNSIEGGDFYFNEKRINDVEPNKRNIGMVFQNYAIFPHLTVRQNVGFGLKNRKCSKEEMESRTDEYLKLMQIEEYKDRLPERLSGGQQQRVALARALVIHPDVLLMDEPLSNLDAKLRVEMRSAIKDIQNQVGITTVYVTHDQEEAMAVSDRHRRVRPRRDPADWNAPAAVPAAEEPVHGYLHRANQYRGGHADRRGKWNRKPGAGPDLRRGHHRP